MMPLVLVAVSVGFLFAGPVGAAVGCLVGIVVAAILTA